MARGSRMDGRWLRGVWASAGRDCDRMKRALPGPTLPARPKSRRSWDEAEGPEETWIVEDLEPLRHEERPTR